MKRCRVRYEGRVQGVGFRVRAVCQSTGLNVHGFVRNEPDGSVLMDVEGTDEDVRQLLDRIEVEMRGNIEASLVEALAVRGHRGGLAIQY